MGFLDHSTNNVIIDAVLTDEGRRLLAANDGSFRISMFSLGDDEVDYSLIKKFGRAVGKEKISKNTPVFEAQTRKDLAIKHRLLTLPDQTVTILPKLAIGVADGWDANSSTLSFNNNSKDRTLSLQQTIEGRAQVPDGLSDSTFSVQIPDRFLRLENNSSGFVSLTPNSRIATYKLVATDHNRTTGGARLELALRMREIDNTTYSIFGTAPAKSTIESVVSIVGDQSGIRLDLNIQITK